MKLAKRISIALLAMCVVGGSALAMTACGGSDPVTSSDPAAVVSTGTETGVQSYLNRDDVQAELQTHIDSVNTEGSMRLRVSAEGNRFVYTYTLLGVTEELTADDFADVRLQYEASHSTFAALISEIETTSGAVDPTVVIRYETETGKIVYELTFTKTEVLQTVPAE